MNFDIALMILATISFLLLLLATAKFYRNAKVIDTSDNIIDSLTKLEKALTSQTSNFARLEERLLSNTEHLYQEGFQQLHRDVNRLVETSTQIQNRLLEILTDGSKHVGSIEAQISALRQHSSEQQALLNRFQQGYDYTVNKGLILGIIRAVEHIGERLESLSDSETEKALCEVADNLLIALESQNVDQFTPQIGAVYKEHIKSAQATRQPTDDTEQVGKIAAVLEPGYMYSGGESERIIKPAKVAVYAADSNDKQGGKE